MKRFTVLTALFSISALSVWAFAQAAPAPRSSAPIPVYDATGEMLKAIHAGDSVAIAPVYDSTGAMLDAINPNKPTASLPYGLTLQDTMADVERKLGQPLVASAPQAGWEPGLPDESGSPDYQTFWAIYRRFGLTIVYNTASATDKSATIYDVILEE